MSILIADSGSTKTTWCLLDGKRKKKIVSQGLSPYFMNTEQIESVLRKELLPKIKNSDIEFIYYYGTGCKHASMKSVVKSALKKVWGTTDMQVEHDLLGAARALCGKEKGVACILGTGSNSCYYNGSKIMKNSPGLGFILGDEGSGSYLGKRVVQYFLYGTFEPDLMDRFKARFPESDAAAILDAVYNKPLPNRYLAGFTQFLAENRGHYMIENILEDGFNDFIFQHLFKYRETWTTPVHFTGSVAYGFRDVLSEMCKSFEIQIGKILKEPMDGLIQYHS
jgi:N-acetylglucosamine kinase-like BadF-type ATPase